MKSNKQQLQQRGWVDKQELEPYQGLADVEYLKKLHSAEACQRTIGAMLIKELTDEVGTQLLQVLSRESCLYTRLAICEKLEGGGPRTAAQMINYLGKIGHNQYQSLPKAPSKKKSYPLARDIIARSLGRMKPQVMETMVRSIDQMDHDQLNEIIDSIGYLAFYRSETATAEICQKMLDLLISNENREVTQWKILTCLSAFPFESAKRILADYAKRKDLLGQEAQRSLKLLDQRQNSSISLIEK